MKRVLIEKYLETIQELKNFLKEHEKEIYEDEGKRCLYSDLLDLELFLKSI